MLSKKLVTILLAITSISLLAVMALYVKLDSANKSLAAGNTTIKSCCGNNSGCNSK